jgi:hypothetical protein
MSGRVEAMSGSGSGFLGVLGRGRTASCEDEFKTLKQR